MPDLPASTWPVERARIVRDSLAVGVATGAYGVSFGAVSVAAGLTVTQTCVLSLLMFTGASQFALVGVLAAGGGPFVRAPPPRCCSAPATRSTACGSRRCSAGRAGGARRPPTWVIDESTAMSVTREHRAAARVGFLTTGAAVFVLWNLATFLGAIAGNTIGDPRTYGLDAAVGGAFLALLWPRLRDGRQPRRRAWPRPPSPSGWCRSPRPACPCSSPAASRCWPASSRGGPTRPRSRAPTTGRGATP